MFDLTPDRCAALLGLMTLITLISITACLCLLISRRRDRRDQTAVKRSLRNLRARDQGAAILHTLTRP